jgi:acyl-coenzyme A thioesterase PaaI-like protein
VIERVNPRRIEGRVTFSRFHLGGRAALHGGVHPLLFDDALGSLVNIDRSHRCRTASLKVNYRRIAPIGVELTFDATVDEISGRKRFTSARLYDESGAVCADAEGLFLELLPGQQ